VKIKDYDVNLNINGLLNGNTVSFANSMDTLDVTTDGLYTLSTLNNESDFDVSITSQPMSLNHFCNFTSANSGTINGNNIQVNIECVDHYSIGGTISGLAANNQVTLQNNLGDDLTLSNNDPFNFVDLIGDGSAYSVTVLTDPTTPNQTCVVSGGENNDGTGVIAGGPDTSIVVTCSTVQYSVGGTVSGLATNNQVILQNNLGDNLTVSANGPFTFLSLIDDELTYSVTVMTNPTSPNQTCTITSNGSGMINGNNVAETQVECVTNSYFIGGSVSGLITGNYLIIINNGNFKIITTNEPYVFETPLLDEQEYNVMIDLQPNSPIQPCTIVNGNSVLAGNDIIDVNIECLVGDDLIYQHGFENP
jgi:hypothetical protein